jgi:co-chaperonin GroES (HSP10)
VLKAAGQNAMPEVQALVGKKVLFKEFAGSWIELAGERTFVVDHEDILGEIQD